MDLHSHVLPGVDDGPEDLDRAMAGVRTLVSKGVERVVATPHFRASRLERAGWAERRLAAFDASFAALAGAIREEGISIDLGRACEFRLDAPATDLSDPRLRLDGSRFVLVEFASFQVPPYGGNQLRAVLESGWVPVLAHPERYMGLAGAYDRVAGWVADGVILQVNTRSLAGGYGPGPRLAACELLARGWVSCVAGDFHCRGRTAWSTVLDLLGRAEAPGGPGGSGSDDPGAREAAGSGAWVRELVYENPRRLLADEAPKPPEGRLVPVTGGRSRRSR